MSKAIVAILLFSLTSNAEVPAHINPDPIKSGCFTEEEIKDIVEEGQYCANRVLKIIKDVNKRDDNDNGRTVLMKAASSWVGSDPLQCSGSVRFRTASDCEYGANIESMKTFIKKGADVNAKDSVFGMTPLMYATNPMPAQLLIQSGADVNAKSNDGLTALMKAERVATAKVLIDSGADVNARDKDGNTVLIHHTQETRYEQGIVDLLIKKGADINAKNKYGETPLMVAIKYHQYYKDDIPAQVKTINTLIANGADLKARDKYGKTVLMKTSSAWIVQFLINKGLDVNARDFEGKTALMHMVEEPNFYKTDFDIIAVLIKNGADVNLKDSSGKTALMYASRLPYPSEFIESTRTYSIKDGRSLVLNTIQYLIRSGASVYARDREGNTALMHARGDMAIQRLLIKNGASVNVKNFKGEALKLSN